VGGQELLAIRSLSVEFGMPDGRVVHALRGVDLTVGSGEVHGVAGESGCGKSATALAVMGLLPVPPARVSGGEVIFQGRNVLEASPEERRHLRGGQMAMIFQEPARYLNPAMRTGEQIAEALRLHRDMDRTAAAAEAARLLVRVGLPATRRVLSGFPHELSGGMRQRVMIAMAVSCRPSLLLADEPTTALDVTLQAQIVELLRDLQRELGMSVVFISHDLGVVRDVADRVSVMYAGRVVESARAADLFGEPLHPYTRALLESIPTPSHRGRRLGAIPGAVPDAEATPAGCAFHPRCPLAAGVCRETCPELLEHRPSHRAACHRVGA
jgi:oligopeptide transport system ATP-binding protein